MQTRQIRMAAVAAVVTACAVVAYVAWGDLEKNLVYYLAADELLAKGPAAHGATVRLGGLVQQGSMHWDPNTLELSFTLGLAASGTPNIAVQATWCAAADVSRGHGRRGRRSIRRAAFSCRQGHGQALQRVPSTGSR